MMLNQTHQPIRLVQAPILLLSDPISIPLDGTYSGGTVIYDLAAALDFYTNYDDYQREIQREARNADRALGIARAQVGTRPPPLEPAPLASDSEWEAYWVALDTDQVTVREARAAVNAVIRKSHLGIIDRVVVEVRFPAETAGPDPDPHDADTWGGWDTAAIGWLAREGLEAALAQMSDPKPAADPVPASATESGPSGSTAPSPSAPSDAIWPGIPSAVPVVLGGIV